MKSILYTSIALIMAVSCCSCEDNSQGSMPLSDPPSLTGTIAWHAASEDSDVIHLYVSKVGGTPRCLSETWAVRNPQNPEFSPDGTELVFMAKNKGSWEVYKYNLTDGKLPVCLTSSLDGDDAWPSYAPDGKTLLFEHKGQIWTMSPEGETSPVTFDIGTSHQSPVVDSDEKRYAFSTGDNDKAYIGIYDASTGVSKVLYDGSGADRNLSTDADGRLFFSARQESGGYKTQVYAGDFNGSKKHALPFNSYFDGCDFPCVINDKWLIVSGRESSSDDMDLWVVNIEDGAVYPLESFVPSCDSGNEYASAYSKYEPLIADPEDGGWRPSEGSGDDIISDTERPQLKGRMVYHNYTSYDSMDSKMYIYDFAANTLECISKDWTNVTHPMNGHFSPAGDFITFMGIGAGGTWDVFIYYFGDKQPVNLTLSGNYRDEDPKVSYDGTRIIFKRNDRLAEITLEDMSLKVLSSISGNGHHSMPYYTTDGKYAVCGCGGEGEDYIGLWDFAAGRMSVLYDRKGVVEYYPITKDAESFYYSAHVSETNRHDQLYKGFFDGSPSEKLKFNATNADYSDACPVSSSWLILCSTRSDSKGGYDLYIAHETTGAIYPLSDYNQAINTHLNELGADYSVK